MKTAEARFWAKVDTTGGFESCWLWQGAQKGKGYGHFFVDGHYVSTHRFALELKLGGPIAPDMQACHTCDNKICCNPAHLYEGTAAENARDASDRGLLDFPRARGDRHGSKTCPEAVPRGVRVHTAKLTEEAVREIRRLSAQGMSSVRLGRAYGVNSSTVLRILSGRRWAHVV